MAGGDRSNQRHEAADHRDLVVELRDQHLTFQEIGDRLGISRQRAHVLHRRAMRERPTLTEAAQRDIERKRAQLARIDEQRRDIEAEREVVMDILHRDGRTIVTASGKVIPDIQDDAGTLAAVDRLAKLDDLEVKLADHEAKLLGLYAPTKSRVEVVDDTVARMLVEQLEAELAELQPEDGAEGA